jgi:hypothetical protein
VSTELISVGLSGEIADGSDDSPRVSTDGRVLFESEAHNLSDVGNANGMNHLYLRDRSTNQTTLIDRAVTGGPSSWGVYYGVSDMSDDGRFITFSSISQDIVWLDMNWQSQVFLYDTVAGPLATQIVSKLPDGTLSDGSSYATSVSGDGRYVVFTTASSNLASPPPGASGPGMLVARDMLDGSFARVDVLESGDAFDQADYYMTPAISADGSSIVLSSRSTNALSGVTSWGQTHVFVLTALSVAPESATFPMAGGSGSFDVDTSAVSGWSASYYDPWIVLVDGSFGAGPRTVHYEVSNNPSGIVRMGSIRVGSKVISIRQEGDGDTTPPVITPIVTGTQVDGWYTSDITVSFEVSDPDSEIVNQSINCTQTLTFTTDFMYAAPQCEATSHGGTATVTVPLRRDATAPTVYLWQPKAGFYPHGTVVYPYYYCYDNYNTVSSCTGPDMGTPIDTSTPGRHTLTVTTSDALGNTATKSVDYLVGNDQCISTPLAPDHLKAWWPLDGNARESISGFEYAPYYPSTYPNGVAGQSWDNSNEFNSIPGINTSKALAAAGLTVAMWVRPDGLFLPSTFSMLVENRQQYQIALWNSTLQWAFNQAGAMNFVNTGIEIPVGAWSHIVVTYKDGVVRTYFNGQLAHTQTLSLPLGVGTTPYFMQLGGMAGGFRAALNGSMDDVMIFDDALSASEIDSLAMAGSGSLCRPFESSLTLTAPATVSGGLYFPVTAVLTDASGRPLPNRPLTITSAVSPASHAVQQVTTNASGSALATFPLDSEAAGGVYEDAFVATFDGDDAFAAASAQSDTSVIAQPPLSWLQPSNITYGTPLGPDQLRATSSLPGTYVYSPAAGTVLEPGNYMLSVTFTPDSQYYAARTLQTMILVLKATPTIEISSAPATYTGQPQAASVVVRGAGGVALTPFTVLYNGSPSAPTNAGTYPITVQFAGNSNYNAVSANGSFVIGKAAPTVAATGGTFTYDGQPHAGSGAATGVQGETLTPVTITYDGSSSTPPTNAGNHTVRASYAGSANYNAAQSADVPLTIDRATPTVDFDTTTAWYGGTARTAIVFVRGVGGVELNPITVTYDGSTTGPVNAGTYALEVRFAGNTNYAPITATSSFVIRKNFPIFPTLNDTGVTYDGQPHSGYNVTIIGVQNEHLTPVTYTFNGSTAVPVNAGTYTVVVGYPGSANYEADSRTFTLTIFKVIPSLTWSPSPSSFSYGAPLGPGQLNAASNTAGSFTYTPPAGTVLNAGPHTLTAVFTAADPVNYESGSLTRTVTVNKVTAWAVWYRPANIVDGTPLSATQLNATAPVPGTFTYSPAAGTVLNAGVDQILHVTFTPDDSVNYDGSNAAVPLTVDKATPVVTWNAPADIVYGTALGAAQLNATANLPGTFSYSPAAGAVLGAGTQTLSATFTPDDAANYSTITSSVTLNVTKAPSTISWTNPADIVYGTALGSAQLNATANVQGTFNYSPAAGTVLGAGTRTLSVTFTPWDANHSAATASVTLNVAKAGTTLIWTPVAPLTYGTPLGAAQLNAFAVAVDGTFSYTPPAGTVLSAGVHTLSVTFTPNDPANYNSASATALTEVFRAASTISWSNPSAIVYGTPLNASQLNATANVPGTFSYSPDLGTVLNAGWHTLSVTFTPADAVNYVDATSSVTLNVAKATPTVSWSSPADIVYGTALSGFELNATSNVPGTLTYSPAAGAVLSAGAQTLSVTFTPDDPANFNGATASVALNVIKAASTITWPLPADIAYGTALGASQLNATANVPGSFSYSPAAGTILGAGPRTLTVTFTPTDTANYAGASTSVLLNVTKAVPPINWPAPSDIVYGTALGATQLNATSSVPGTLVYVPAAGTVLSAGSQILEVTFTPDDAANYTSAIVDVMLNVTKATPTISWSNPAGIVYGTALGGSQLNATANVPGTFAYSPAAGTTLNAGSQTLSVSFAPADSMNYNGATATVTLNVAKATPVVSWSNPAGISYGTALSGTQLNATASIPGSFAYSPAAGTVLNAGTQSLSVTFTPTDAANYTTATASSTISIAQKALTVQTNNATKVYGAALPAFTASGTGFVNGDSMSSLAGTLAFTTSATATSAPGSYPVTPGGVSSANYSITFANGTLTVTAAATSVTFTTSPNPSNNNQTVQLRAVVAAVAPGAGTPTGTVEFRESGTLLGTATLVNGVATMNKSFKRGTHPLTATYTGSTNFTGSSGSVTHQTQ